MIRSNCVICGEDLTYSEIINLPRYPITEIFVDEFNDSNEYFKDQSFLYCNNCGHGQLKYILDKENLYGKDYKYRTTKSTSGREGIKYFSQFIYQAVNETVFDKVIDIGCNDGHLLDYMKAIGRELIGIDPNVPDKCSGKKLIKDYVENCDIDCKGALVICSHVIEHLEEPRHFLENVLKNSDEKTTFIFAFPSLDLMIEDSRFDLIYHHHQHYFSLNSFLYLLNELGCYGTYEFNPHHWGSLYVVFKKSKEKHTLNNKISSEYIKNKYSLFLESIEITRRTLNDMKSKNLCGYGATFQIPIINYYIPEINNLLLCIYDDDINKDGLYYIGMKPKITYPTNVDLSDKSLLITAISYTRSILRNILYKNPKKIYVIFNHI